MIKFARLFAIAGLLTITACSTINSVEPTSPYQPQYTTTERTLGNLNVDAITKAPLQYYGAVRLNASPNRVAEYMANIGATGEWIPMLKVAKLDHAQSTTPGKAGEGSLRYVVVGGDELKETIAYWEPGVGYGYVAEDQPNGPMTDHLGVIQVESDKHGGTVLTYRQYFNPSDNLKGKIIPLGMGVMLNGALDNLADRFGGERL